MSNGTEKRRHVRTDIRWPVTMETSSGVIKGETRNLSPIGAYIRCPVTSEPGEEVALTISPDNHTALKIKAEVIWAATGPPFGMGVTFSIISKADSQFISEAVSKVVDPRINKQLKLI